MVDIYTALHVTPHPNFMEIGKPTMSRVLEYEEQIKSLQQELDKIKNTIDKCISSRNSPSLFIFIFIFYCFKHKCF